MALNSYPSYRISPTLKKIKACIILSSPSEDLSYLHVDGQSSRYVQYEMGVTRNMWLFQFILSTTVTSVTLATEQRQENTSSW